MRNVESTLDRLNSAIVTMDDSRWKLRNRAGNEEICGAYESAARDLRMARKRYLAGNDDEAGLEKLLADLETVIAGLLDSPFAHRTIQ